MARLIDISLPISEQLPVWPGDPPIKVERPSDMQQGAEVNITSISAGVHTGTHLDAPRHFIKDGAPVDQLALEIFIGPCYVAQLDGNGPISAEELEAAQIPAGTSRLLLRTSNSAQWERDELTFFEDFRALDRSAAQWVIERGIQLVGIDYLSIEPFKAEAGHPVHTLLLGAGIVAVEGLRLGHVESGRYHLTCLPLKLVGSDGSPVRAILSAED